MSEQDLQTSGGSAADPTSAFAGSAPETAVTVAEKPAVTYFNFVVHEAVQKLHGKGLWYAMGPRYGGLLWRIRPFHHPAVVAKAEFVEKAVRLREKYDEKDEISGEHRMEINRAAIIMATTAVKGYINVGAPDLESKDADVGRLVESAHEALAAARSHKLQIVEGDGGLLFIHFDGSETEKPLRDVIEPILTASVSMLNQLFRASNNLQKVKDEEIYRLGEAYVYGLAGEYDWAD